jgi:hypothetical protein
MEIENRLEISGATGIEKETVRNDVFAVVKHAAKKNKNGCDGYR